MKYMTNKLKNNKGFTLVEVLIVAGLLAGLSLVLMNINKQQAVSQKKAETSIEMTSVHSAIVANLLNSESCTKTLAPSGDIRSATLTEIRNRRDEVIYNTTDIYNNLIKIESMDIEGVSILPAVIPAGTKGYGELSIRFTYEKTAKILPGTAKTLSYVLPLRVEVDETYKVTRCYASTENAVDTAKNESCIALNGVFNLTTQKCNLKDYAALEPIAKNTAVSNDYLNDYKTNFLDPRYVNVTGDTMIGPLAIASADLTLTNGTATFTNYPMNMNNSTLSIAGSGNILQTGTGYISTAQYVTVSDEKLKKNIKSLDPVKDKIYALKGVQFDWKSSGESDYGFIAQEVEKVLPLMVKTDPKSGIKAVKYTNLIPLLVEDMKALRDQNTKLQKENTLLRRDIDEIKKILRKKTKK